MTCSDTTLIKTRTLATVRRLGAALLLLPGLVHAVPDIVPLAPVFTSADPARANGYMDSGGVWNGTAEVTNTTGDRFSFVLRNQAAGDTVPPVDETIDAAFDVAITIALPAGFRLSSAALTPAVSNPASFASCALPGDLQISQLGQTVTIASASATPIVLPAQNCQYSFEFGLTTASVAPFVQGGNYNINYNVTYALAPADPPEPPVQATQPVEVRMGDVAVLKVANTPNAGNGDTVNFTVSILGSGDGGNFQTVLTDILSANLTGLNIIAPPTPPSVAGPGANQRTFAYIAPNQQADLTVTAVVNVDPNALTCPILRNTAQVQNRTGSSNSFFADVPFNLENPLLNYTPPTINVPLGDTVPYSMQVQNTGAGIARNVSITPLGLDPGFVITLPPTETDWIWTGTAFQYVGDPLNPNDNFLTGGQITTIDFLVTVNAASCPGPAGGTIQWTPNYENVCGTVFSPPIRFAGSNVTNVPELDIDKITSAPALNIGDSGFYTITLDGADLNRLPAGNFSMTDTLPLGVSNAVINTIPAGTQIFINGSPIPYVAGTPIPDGALINMTGNQAALQNGVPPLTINYVVGAAACPGGQFITNTANLAFANCGINEADAATFIANANPAEQAAQNLTVNGATFETGLIDTNGVPGNANEGDHIEFTVVYEFPDPDGAGPQTFPGVWVDSTFEAELGAELAEPLTLINNLPGFAGPMTITVERISTATVVAPEQVVPGIASNATGPLNIDLDFIAGLIGDANVNDYRITFRYTATGRDQALGAGTVANYVENTTLTVNNGPEVCPGFPEIYVQGVELTLARAELTLDINLNNGNPIEVCAIVPVTLDIDGPDNGTRADNIQLFFNQSSYEFLGGVTYGGMLATINNAPTPPSIDITNNTPTDVLFTVNPNTTDFTAPGSATFNVRLRSNAVPTTLNAQLRYDDNQTSPDIGAAENDRDFVDNDTANPNVLAGDLRVEFLPPLITLLDQLTYIWTAQVVNVGTGTAYGASFTTTLPAEFIPDATTPATVCNSMTINPVITGQTMDWDLGDLPPGETCNVIVRGTITQNSCFQPQTNPANQITASAQWGCGVSIPTSITPPAPVIELPERRLELFHDTNNSFCELCGQGEIRLTINNAGSVEISNIDITEDLLASGLIYVNGSTRVRIDGGAPIALPGVSPSISGSQLTWDFDAIANAVNLVAPGTFISSGLSSAFATLPRNPRRVELIYNVNSPGETLVDNVRNIRAFATFDLFCNLSSSTGTGSQLVQSDLFDLPFRQPIPDVTKFGRNVSAGQTSADYGAALPDLSAGDVPGGARDSVIWRIDIENNGLDALEDLRLLDLIGPPPGALNFDFAFICPTDAEAETALANGSAAGTDCVPIGGNSVDFDVDDPFGNPSNDANPGISDIDVPANGNAQVYLAGFIQSICTNNTNRADIEWGCEIDSVPPGGINASTPGVNPAANDNDSALLSTEVDPSGVIVQQTVTGLDLRPGLGFNGIVTVTVRNQSGGTIRNIRIADVLPADYEIDTTFNVQSSLVVTPAFGNFYRGIVSTINVDSSNPAQPVFTFSPNPGNLAAFPEQNNVLRHGDILQFQIYVVRNDPNDFDRQNNPEVRVESPATNTDPDLSPNTGINRIDIEFENTCGINFVRPPNNLNISIVPEDLDINIINPNDPADDLIFILSDPAAFLDLDVVVNNASSAINGHDARNYDVYVTVGLGLDVIITPPSCDIIDAGNPPLGAPPEIGTPPNQPNGVLPPAINDSASVTYRCERSTSNDNNPANDILGPGVSDTFAFRIQRNIADTTGDLTFRADVLGRILLSDGSALPDVIDPLNQARHSKDNIIARIIGFNLFKRLLGNCSEDNPPAVNSNVQIGEECTYQVEANWFGFATPGFGNISINNAYIYEGSSVNNPPAVITGIPAALEGQGIVALPTTTVVDENDNPVAVSVTTSPASPGPLDETGFTWALGPIDTGVLTTPQVSFFAEARFRTLNGPDNGLNSPNQHGAIRTDEVNARFEVVFPDLSVLPLAIFDNSTTGYPEAAVRTVDITITEPNITVVKEVCNETDSIDLNGPGAIGPLCAPFSTTVQGDSNDRFIYRLTVTNEAAADGVPRAPAYNVIVTDDLDPTDELTPQDLATDGFDNDGDGVIDENTLPDTIEGVIIDNVPPLGDRIVFSHTHSTALERINPGDSVALYYRALPALTVVPQQILENTAFATYDSLEGASGNQSAPQGANGEREGAREYRSADAIANLEIDDVIVPPGSKRFSVTSRRDDPDGPVALAPTACTPQPCVADNVVIGEEVIIDLVFEIPPATLNNFVLTDNLPPGLECIELLNVTLPTALPNGVFSPGGTFGQGGLISNPYNPVTQRGFACDQTRAQWDFGNQSMTDPGTLNTSADGERYVLTARFVARVLNTAQNNDSDLIANGGGSAGGGTEVTLAYNDASGGTITQVLTRADLTVQEPLIVLQKFFGLPNPSGDPPPNLVDVLANADEGDIITVEVYAENTGTSPAYNLTIVDALSAIPNLEIVQPVVLSGPNQPAANVVGGNVTFTFAPNNPVPAGGAFNFGFQVRVIGPPAPETVIGNTIDASWTSLPDNNVALNSGGAIGVDGAGNGMRNGQIPPDGGINDYEANAVADFAVPAIDIAKTDLNPAIPPTIGQRKNYRIQLLLPESNADNVVVTDNLASGDVTFVLENNATFGISYTCSGINTIRGSPVDCSSEATATATITAALGVNEPADQSIGLVTWNFGEIVTAFENDAVVNAINPEININYFARINNDLDTDAGDLMQNGAQVTYTGSTGPFVSAAPQITVVEPLLNVSKALTPPGTPPDGGDTLTYTVTIQNVGGSDAFDVNIVDTLSDGLEFSQTVSALLDSAVIPGFNITPQGVPGGPLIWGREQTPSDETLDIPAGSTFVLVYEVTVDDTVGPQQPLSNSVLVDWTSLDGANIDERTGAGCPVISAPDDYCSAPQTTSVDAGNNNFITKTRTDDTYPGTPDDVRIGDIVQYTLAVNLQEGRIPNVVVSDVLPAGMQFVRTVSINGDIAAPFSANAPFVYADIPLANTPVAPDTSLTWTIGQVINAADNNPANDVLLIVYEARVIDHVAIPFPTTGSSTDSLLNTATLNYRLYDDVTDATPQVDTETIFVQQPLIELATISKLRTDSGDVMVTANQTIEFTLQVCNIGTAPAYDLVISDTLPAELNDPGAPLPDPDVVSVFVGGVDRTAIYDENGPGYNFAAGVIRWTFDNDALSHTAPDNCVDIVYRVNVDPEVGAGAIFSNAMQVDVYHSRDDGDPFEVATRRTYPPVGPVSVTIMSQTPMGLEKDGPPVATPGDAFSYTLTFPDSPAIATLYDVLIEDDLPPGVTYVNSTFGTGNGAVGLTDNTVTGSNNVRLSLASVPAGTQAVVNINVRLNDTVGNVAGATITNTANYRFAPAPGEPSNIAGGVDDHTLTVVEPQPQITKTELGPVSDPGANGEIDLGIPEQFSLTVENNLPNASTIWQATIVDELPPEMRAATPPAIDAISINGRVLSEGTPDDYDVLYDSNTGLFQIVLKSIAARIEPGEVLTIVYTAGLIDDTGDALTITNRSLVGQWFSQDISIATPPDTRTYNRALGDGTPMVAGDDFAHDLTLTTRAPVLTVIKNVVNLSSGLNPGIAAAPGDTLQYTVTVSNAGTLSTIFSIVDEIDALNIPGAFVAGPGSLTITSPVDPSWINNSNANGGVNGSGLIDIENITISELTGGNNIIQIVFEATLQSPLANGTIVANQAILSAAALTDILSDNPNTPAPADPTLTIIGSAPSFIFEKISDDLTGDPAVLLGGDTLRYTITVKNAGDANTVGARLTDQIPANTAYVAGSTTLNGAAVADIGDGISPLQDGLLINSPDVSTPGVLTANSDPAANNVAVITFDVTINNGLVNGTIISNQGTLTGEILQNTPQATPTPFLPVFSDDPGTPAIIGDPTQDVVGFGVNIDAHKTVQHLIDQDGDGEIEPGDTLRYSIIIVNNGNIDAGNVLFIDDIPVQTTYVPNSTMLDAAPVADSGGQSQVSSAQGGLSIPLPAGGSAVVIFDVTVNAVPPGTIISNQGVVTSAMQPDELTDADGNDENGNQPTVVIVGGQERLDITKEVVVVGGGVVRAGGELEYIVTVTNTSSSPVNDAIVTDNIPAGTALVAGSALLNGFSHGVTETGASVTANHGAAYGDLAPGERFILRFRVRVNDGLPQGTPISNTATVTWNAGADSASDTANVDVGGTPGAVNLNGRIWLDPDHNAVFNQGVERTFENWIVRVYFNNANPSLANTPIATFATDANGEFAFNGLAPGGPYTLIYAVPEGDANYPPGSNIALGVANASVGTGGLMRINAINAQAGRNVREQNLPVDPNGVVYNSITRTQVPPGARVSLRLAGNNQPVPASCYDTPAHLDSQQQQITGPDGFYRFDLNFSNAGCPSGAMYRIFVELPENGVLSENVSTIIPPEAETFNTVNCTVDYVPTTPQCEVLPFNTPPVADIPPGPGTAYYLDVSYANTSQALANNHIPVDDVPDGLLNVAKTTPLKNVVRGDLVPYTITISNPQEFTLSALIIRDVIPPGFKYIERSARMDGLPMEPQVDNRVLTWEGLAALPGQTREIKLLLVVGAGVSEGEYTNTAQGFIAGSSDPISGLASATVRVVPDPTFDCSDIIGRVFEDVNANGYPDDGEPGIAGARVVTAKGLLTTADEYGRFHIVCALVPNQDRGSNFILKLDERSLPSGYRVTTENPRVQRLTRGKVSKFNFGATVHRVVRLDLANAAFEPGSTNVHEHWQYVIDGLIEQLQQGPSVLRVSYLGDSETESLVKQRIRAIKQIVQKRWKDLSCCYNLEVETEIFWRTGKPGGGR